MTQREEWLTVSEPESTIELSDKGRIVDGTGAYDDARGRVRGGGWTTFTPTAIDPHLLFVLNVKQDD